MVWLPRILRLLFGREPVHHELTGGNEMFAWRFWRETIERATKSGAQAVVLALGGGINLYEMNVTILLGAAGAGALLSLLTSLATVGVGAAGSPSAID